MKSLPPYALFLGIEVRRSDAGERLYVMPFSDRVLGRPGFLHGGAIAALLEFAAFGRLFDELEGESELSVKPINVTTSFMRGGGVHDTFATARITRIGKRVANLEAHAWQEDRDRPIASAQLNLLLKRTTPGERAEANPEDQ